MKTKDQLTEINSKFSTLIELQKEAISHLEWISIHAAKEERVNNEK